MTAAYDLEPGQTEGRDALRLHLYDVHHNLDAVRLTDEEAIDQHRLDHYGPSSVRHHDPDTVDFSDFTVRRDLRRLALLRDGTFDASTFALNAHLHRRRHPGQASTKPWIDAPNMYEEVSRYTVSILPPDHPQRRLHQIHVVNNAAGRPAGPHWSVEHGGFRADRGGHWAVIHNDGTDGYRFTEDEARDLAHRLAPTVRGDGERTALDVLNTPSDRRR